MTVKVEEKKNPSPFSLFNRNIFQFDELGVFCALIVIGILLAYSTEEFFTLKNLINVARQASYVGIMTIGMAFVISQGDIDISVGAMFNFLVTFMAVAMQKGLSHNFVIPVGIIAGALLGLFNGGLMIGLKIPSLIVTLGTMTIFKGMSLTITNATTVSGFPKDNWFINIMGGNFLGIVPASVVVMFIVTILGYMLYNHTAFGRIVCAVGANKEVARFSGIHPDGTRLLSMMLSGIMCAIAAVCALSFLGAADTSIGLGSEMLVIASVIIGGASLTGGSGSIPGAVIGALIISVIRNGLVLLGVSIYWQGVVTGATIIAAVALDYVIKQRR